MNLSKRIQKQPGKVKHEDEMIQEIEIKGNKVVNDLPLLEGTYTIIVLSNKERTRKEWQEYYHAILDDYCKQTGNNKIEMHEMFKKEQKFSTRTLEEHRWPLIINELKKWTIINS